MISIKRIAKSGQNRRAGFTLLELLLSLALIVVATGIIGSIMQMYARNFNEKSDEIRRKQLARAILNMIAEDIRAVVIEQEYDSSVLAAQLGVEDTGGGEAAPDEGGGTGLASDASSSATDPALATETEDPNALADSSMFTSDLPPGIYGDQFSLLVDVSRLPRQDEYMGQQNGLMSGTLNDIPGDIKRVQYFVQAMSMMGVSDDMASFSNELGGAVGPSVAGAGFSSGLVRRALDVGVLGYAEEVGDVDRIQRTGDLVAPEVISLQFAYFDILNGEWVYEWDSSQQSLPGLVQISLAIQTETSDDQVQIPAGTPLASLTYEDQKAYGIEVTELVVAIPGALLIAADAAAQADAAAGMESMGL